jgi:prepilin-type N-terminal cleavage/methylation domain-containing protein
MKKKGFTLIELLAVIVLLAIISLIIFPIVTNQINTSKENLYDVQVENIIKAAKDMILNNQDLLDENHVIPTLISIEDLQTTTSDGVSYLEEGDILSPIDNTKMNGTVIITYDTTTKEYTYEYQEKTKEQLASLIVTPAAKTVIASQSVIYTNERQSGLFEDVTNNEYVFRGGEPKNFLKIGTDLWRIISINKDTYEMKIAKTTRTTKSVWTNDTTKENYILANGLKIYEDLNSSFYNSLNIKDQIVENAKWNVGVVSLTNKDIKSIMQEEAKSTLNANVGLLTVSDIARATYTLSCRTDMTDEACYATNYLILSNTYFLANTKGSEVYVVDGTSITTQDVQKQAVVVPVIYLQASAQVETGHEGTSTDPYVLKVN